MKIGTKSVLFGAHCFFMHPLFVAWAWTKLYGFPWDPRLWVAFFVHDLGYIGKPNMDGPEGEEHPLLGAKIMGFLFGKKWYDFTLGHSRHYAKRNGIPISRLCVADKMVPVLQPAWLYLPMVTATGEIKEYMANARERALTSTALTSIERAQLRFPAKSVWYKGLQSYMIRWVDEHKDGGEDTWTQLTPRVA